MAHVIKSALGGRVSTDWFQIAAVKHTRDGPAIGGYPPRFLGLAASSVSSDGPITGTDPTVIGLPVVVGIVLVKFSSDLGSL